MRLNRLLISTLPRHSIRGDQDGQGPDTVGSSLDDLIGTWSRADADEMERAMRHFETIDEAAWE